MKAVDVDSAGRRWRATGKKCRRETCDHGPNGSSATGIPCDGWDELPDVPGWPKPAPAPQFLSEDPKLMLRDGDLVAIHYQELDLWHLTHHEQSGDPNHDPLGSVGGERRWLIARADRGEDV